MRCFLLTKNNLLYFAFFVVIFLSVISLKYGIVSYTFLELFQAILGKG